MVDGMKTKPTLERQREYRGGQAYGLYLKGMSDAQEAKKAEAERKAAPPTERLEVWTYSKKRGDFPPGRYEVRRHRSAQGKFAKPSVAQELAARFGLMLGNEVPPPKRSRL